ncbi:MAG: 2Fe-2S iron-sulfur cluster-binding protein [Halobellus sp.]|uniref:2Fe-2S iron-sulfur cluster-binding protein n=1 Tax=Halobellus sp. TaxID=1979212 RepID=UPI0035D3FE2B
MVEINFVGLGLGVTLTLLVVAIHYARGTGWTATGDISQEVLEQRASTLPETDFPEPMNRSIGGGAAPAGGVVGGEEGAELEEAEEAEEVDPSDIPEDEIEYFEVEFAKQGETIEVSNDEPLLDQGEEEGWDLPYACRQGQCVSCAGQITSGGNSEDYIEHDNQQMLDDAELGEGYTLTCVAYPRADFTIETGEAP